MFAYYRGERTITGFKINTWGGEKERSISLVFADNETRLIVTLEETECEDVDYNKLLQFLKDRGVITDPTKWKVEKDSDTSGNTMIDELWCTIEFRRTSAS